MSSVVGNVWSGISQNATPITLWIGAAVCAVGITACAVVRCIAKKKESAYDASISPSFSLEKSVIVSGNQRSLSVRVAVTGSNLSPEQKETARVEADAAVINALDEFLNNAPADQPGMRLRSGRVKPLAL